MNYKQLFFLTFIITTNQINAELITTNDLMISIKKLNSTEKKSFFSCLNPIKSRHLTAKYTLFELKIKNKSNHSYLLDAQHSGLELMSPERIAQRVSINRSWIPITLATMSAVILSSIFYIAYVPCIALSATLGIAALTVNPHKTSEQNQQKMLAAVLDGQHTTMIPSYSKLKKMIVIRTRKNRKKQGVLYLNKNCEDLILKEKTEIKIPMI